VKTWVSASPKLACCVAAGDENDERAGVDALVDRMHFDRRIVDVDDALDASGDGLRHVVDFGLGEAILLEERRVAGNNGITMPPMTIGCGA
jgi:hypothetical protein